MKRKRTHCAEKVNALTLTLAAGEKSGINIIWQQESMRLCVQCKKTNGIV